MPPSGRTTRSFFRAARYGLVACVLWMGVSDAAAQLPADPGASAVATPSIEGVFDRPELGAVRAELIALRAQLDGQGLPGVMVDEKAAEGLSKHIPGQLILAACRQVAVRLDSARGALGSLRLPLDRELLRAMVDAQAVGASADALVALGQQVRAPVRAERVRTTLVALQAVAELGEREFEIGDALTAVGAAVRSGGHPAVRDLLVDARALRGTPSARGLALRERATRGRPESPGRSGSSHGNGPPHDVGYGQGRGRGNGVNMGMNPG